jgi:hypothetical protein
MAIAALALIALIGSVLGVLLYEVPENPEWDVRFTETAATSWFTGSYTGAATDTRALDQENVTLVRFEMTATGDAPVRPQAVTVTVTITPPTGAGPAKTMSATLGSPTGGSATASVEFPYFIPADYTTRASDAGAALADAPANTTATGDWRIQVQVAGATAVETVTVGVTGTYRFYVAAATERLPDLSPAA